MCGVLMYLTNVRLLSRHLRTNVTHTGCRRNGVFHLQVLDTTHSHRITRKVQEVFKKVVTGLMENVALTTEALAVFCHGLVSEAFPQLSVKQRLVRTIRPLNKYSDQVELLILQEVLRRFRII